MKTNKRSLRLVFMIGGISMLSIASVETVVATANQAGSVLQSDPGFICNSNGKATFLGELLNNLLSFLFVSGVPVFIFLYQLDGILEFFALGADTKAKIKKHERNLWLGAAKIYLAPVLLKLLAVDVMGLSFVGCLNLLPSSLLSP